MSRWKAEQRYFAQFCGCTLPAEVFVRPRPLRLYGSPQLLIVIERMAMSLPGVNEVKWQSESGAPYIQVFYNNHWTKAGLLEAIDCLGEYGEEFAPGYRTRIVAETPEPTQKSRRPYHRRAAE